MGRDAEYKGTRKVATTKIIKNIAIYSAINKWPSTLYSKNYRKLEKI